MSRQRYRQRGAGSCSRTRRATRPQSAPSPSGRRGSPPSCRRNPGAAAPKFQMLLLPSELPPFSRILRRINSSRSRRLSTPDDARRSSVGRICALGPGARLAAQLLRAPRRERAQARRGDRHRLPEQLAMRHAQGRHDVVVRRIRDLVVDAPLAAVTPRARWIGRAGRRQYLAGELIQRRVDGGGQCRERARRAIRIERGR
jgi:hypothetical protein